MRLYARIFLLGTGWLLFSLSLMAQSRFAIVSVAKPIAMEFPKAKDSLNKQLTKLRDKNQVFSVINKRLRLYRNAPVKLMETLPDNSHLYYIYMVSAPTEIVTSIRELTGTRSLDDETIYKKYEFVSFFSDTLVILDTLVIHIYPADFNFPADSYSFQDAVTGLSTTVPSTGKNELLVAASMFLLNAGNTVHASLYNNAQPGKALANCVLYFLSGDDKEDLQSVRAVLEEQNRTNPDYTTERLCEDLTNYIKMNWGNISRKNLLNWLNKTHQ